ncbi:hypothetical protein OH77DRAFT_53202 [Trametes cingulata]|nr:hypothetical protein OH77DRAFT_53202 [Trametes cingulata]
MRTQVRAWTHVPMDRPCDGRCGRRHRTLRRTPSSSGELALLVRRTFGSREGREQSSNLPTDLEVCRKALSHQLLKSPAWGLSDTVEDHEERGEEEKAHFGFAARAVSPSGTPRGRVLIPRTTKRYAPGPESLPRGRNNAPWLASLEMAKGNDLPGRVKWDVPLEEKERLTCVGTYLVREERPTL